MSGSIGRNSATIQYLILGSEIVHLAELLQSEDFPLRSWDDLAATVERRASGDDVRRGPAGAEPFNVMAARVVNELRVVVSDVEYVPIPDVNDFLQKGADVLCHLVVRRFCGSGERQRDGDEALVSELRKKVGSRRK